MSSSSSSGHVLQSCLEPPQVLVPSKQAPSLLWLQKQSEADEMYVHPLMKRSSKTSLSLDMCTESLGNETGSSSMYEYRHHALEKMSSSKNQNPKAGDLGKKVKKIISFPPPLSSVSQIESCRGEGRLVIRAISSSSCSSYFRVERENGRLRLSLLRDGDDDDEVEEEECELEDVNADDHHDPEPETVKENEGEICCSCISRCNGDGTGNNRITSLPFYVAIS